MLDLVFQEAVQVVMVVMVVHQQQATELLADTALSGSYTMTLGEENLSNATGNVALIRIALDLWSIRNISPSPKVNK